MERVLISRQPIYQTDMTEFGYQLLYCQDEDENASSDGNNAVKGILNTFEIGLEELVAGQLAFINVDRTLIIDKYCESLPQKLTVLEILDDVEPDRVMLQGLEELTARGYRIALGNFTKSERFPAMLKMAKFVRLNAGADDSAMLERSAVALRKYPVRLIAENVATREQFDRCKGLGFDYIQGHFFCQPQVVEGRRVPVNRLTTVNLIASLNDPDLKIKDLEEAIVRDAALCYKLMRFTNSAMCGLNRAVETIRHAILMVGLEKIRIWASLLLFSGFEDKPRDVIVTGTVRARMCEQLAKTLGTNNPDRLFLVGLFSVLDAILDQPLGQAVGSLPLTAAVRDAILYQKGDLGAVLRCAKAYEQQNWAQAQIGPNLKLSTIRHAYQEAVQWSLRALTSLA